MIGKNQVTKNRVLVTVVLTICIILSAYACQQNSTAAGGVMNSFYVKNHWIPLPLPDSRFAPGTIFTYSKDTGIRYVSSLKTCGVPDDVATAVTGQSGSLNFTGNSEYGAEAVLKLRGVSAGPEFSKVKKTTVALDSHGPASIDLFKLQIWITNPTNAAAFPQACKDGLAQPDTYIVQEGYLVSKGKYSLHDETGAKIALTNLKIGPVSLDPNAHVQVTGDGSLVFDQALYTAVRRVRRINGGFQSLGSSAQAPDADNEILKNMTQ